jgi:putative hemolysin
MKVLSIVASPIVRLLSVSTEVLLRIFGLKPGAEPAVTEEEIRMLIRQGTAAGVFQEAEENLVENVFRLGDRRVSALITPRHEITWLDVDEPVEVNQRIVTESPHSRFPICRTTIDNVIGIVRAKDLLAQQIERNVFDLQAVAREPLFIPGNTRALDVLDLFKQTGRHVGMVVDEHGGIEGLVTHHDLLEAIVGAISLLGEPVEAKAVQREDGSWLLDGALLIDEFKDLFHIKYLPGEGTGTFQTLGGFVMMHLGHIPSMGEHFEWNRLRFEVVDMDGRRVDEVLVTQITKD